MTKVFCWDEVGCEVNEFEVTLPDGCTPRQALILADDQIAEQTECADTFDKKVRQVENRADNCASVFVLDGLFGHDKETHVYWTAEGSLEECRALADRELAAYFAKSEEDED